MLNMKNSMILSSEHIYGQSLLRVASIQSHYNLGNLRIFSPNHHTSKYPKGFPQP